MGCARLLATMQILEEIPSALAREVKAALAWVNAEQGCHSKVSDVVDPEAVERAGDEHPLPLILCDGDLCVREDLRVRASAGAFVLFPAGWVVLALIAYAAVAARGVLKMNRAFQSVEP